MFRIVASLFTGVMILVACGDFTAPENAIQFTPPIHYRTIAWTSVVRCTGTIRAYEDIEWYVVPGTGGIRYSDRFVAGVWEEPNRIYVAEPWLDHRPTIQNELVHYATQIADHDDPQYRRASYPDPMLNEWHALAPHCAN